MPATTRSESRKGRRTIKKPDQIHSKVRIPDGLHKVLHANGSTYFLPMRDGQINGVVRWRGPDHSVDVEYEDGKQHGFERVRWDDGATAESMWKNGIKEGIETKRTASGSSVCIGNYVGGVLTGPGIIYHNLHNPHAVALGLPIVKLQNFEDDSTEGPHAYVTWNQRGELANERLKRLVAVEDAKELPTAELKRDVFARLSNAIEDAKEEVLTGAKYLELCDASKAVHSIVPAV